MGTPDYAMILSEPTHRRHILGIITIRLLIRGLIARNWTLKKEIMVIQKIALNVIKCYIILE